MSTGAFQPVLDHRTQPQGGGYSHRDSDLGTLLGLYHGYDQARIALARLVAEFGSEAADDARTRRRIWSRVQRQGIAPELFEPPGSGSTPGVNQAAHTATLSAFALVCDKAEELLRAIHARWPELCEHAGGPLPMPASERESR